MKNMYSKLVEKFLFYIPFLMFVLYTNVHFLFAIRSNSKLISEIIKLFNSLHMKSAYIYLVISLFLGIYILIKGNKKQIAIMGVTLLGCFLTYYNLLAVKNYLTVFLFISSYLIGIFYTLALMIYLKDKEIKEVKRKVVRGIKFSIIYLLTIFVLADISNTSQYSYTYAGQGVTAWIRSTNGLGHALVFFLPLLVLFYLKEKKNKYLLYIIIVVFLDLLIATKACYFGLLSTLIVTIIYLTSDYFKEKKYPPFKLISLVVILVVVLSSSSDLYVTENIKKSIDTNTNEAGEVDVVNFVISDRTSNLGVIKESFKEEDFYSKTFGLGLYYPKYHFIYTELDLYDILYSRGIYGLILYIVFFGALIIGMVKKGIKNIKENFDIAIILMILTIGYIGFTALFVGHVAFNLMSLTTAIMVILYYRALLNKEEN